MKTSSIKLRSLVILLFLICAFSTTGIAQYDESRRIPKGTVGMGVDLSIVPNINFEYFFLDNQSLSTRSSYFPSLTSEYFFLAHLSLNNFEQRLNYNFYHPLGNDFYVFVGPQVFYKRHWAYNVEDKNLLGVFSYHGNDYKKNFKRNAIGIQAQGGFSYSRKYFFIDGYVGFGASRRWDSVHLYEQFSHTTKKYYPIDMYDYKDYYFPKLSGGIRLGFRI